MQSLRLRSTETLHTLIWIDWAHVAELITWILDPCLLSENRRSRWLPVPGEYLVALTVRKNLHLKNLKSKFFLVNNILFICSSPLPCSVIAIEVICIFYAVYVKQEWRPFSVADFWHVRATKRAQYIFLFWFLPFFATIHLCVDSSCWKPAFYTRRISAVNNTNDMLYLWLHITGIHLRKGLQSGGVTVSLNPAVQIDIYLLTYLLC